MLLKPQTFEGEKKMSTWVKKDGNILNLSNITNVTLDKSEVDFWIEDTISTSFKFESQEKAKEAFEEISKILDPKDFDEH